MIPIISICRFQLEVKKIVNTVRLEGTLFKDISQSAIKQPRHAWAVTACCSNPFFFKEGALHPLSAPWPPDCPGFLTPGSNLCVVHASSQSTQNCTGLFSGLFHTDLYAVLPCSTMYCHVVPHWCCFQAAEREREMHFRLLSDLHHCLSFQICTIIAFTFIFSLLLPSSAV